MMKVSEQLHGLVEEEERAVMCILSADVIVRYVQYAEDISHLK